MGYYTYKDVCHREDFVKLRERMVADGFEDDGDPNYDGSYWSIASELLDEKDERIKALESDVDRIRAEARREALREASKAVRAKRSGFPLSERDVVLTEACEAIEALMPKEGERG